MTQESWLTIPEFELPWMKSRGTPSSVLPHLVLWWSVDEPQRVGEALPIVGPTTLGRGFALSDDPAPRSQPEAMRPSRSTPTGALANARISRVQLWVEPRGEDAIFVRCIGRTPMLLHGRPQSEGIVRMGELIELRNAALFMLSHRPNPLAALRSARDPDFGFGVADAFGLVGECEATWKLRDAYAFAATTDRHVLLLGESGVGKELGARTIHGLSNRRQRPLVSRNAATLPDSLIDAELFGNVKNYPNPGMPERLGLVGEADGSTLFLDEIGDLPEKSQVHLLRVLDGDGEYQRLGEARPRKSSLRLVAATNRPLSALKHDFLARFTHRIEIPGLDERREDIPLLLAHLLRRIALDNPALAARFFERRQGALAEPRVAPDFARRLASHEFTHHVRELERLIWLALSTAEGDFIGVTREVERELKCAPEPSPTMPVVEWSEVDRDSLLKALAEHDQSPTRAAKALGLKNRYVLLRLLKKHGISTPGEGSDE